MTLIKFVIISAIIIFVVWIFYRIFFNRVSPTITPTPSSVKIKTFPPTDSDNLITPSPYPLLYTYTPYPTPTPLPDLIVEVTQPPESTTQPPESTTQPPETTTISPDGTITTDDYTITGGIFSSDGIYNYIIFLYNSENTSPKSFSLHFTSGSREVYYLVVGGGGAGGQNAGGGGGGGGVRNGVLPYTSGTTYTVVVGAGGLPGRLTIDQQSNDRLNTSGGDSMISGEGLTTIKANGGGRGGSQYSGSSESVETLDGGSGGGGAGGNISTSNVNGGKSTDLTEGSNGGNGSGTAENNSAGGGGGGAGGQGVQSSINPFYNYGGVGGGAKQWIINGLYYGWGGGGGINGGQMGGVGIGGGNGSSLNIDGKSSGGDGSDGFGNGGGGSCGIFSNYINNTGGKGGSGTVIIAWLVSPPTPVPSPTPSVDCLTQEVECSKDYWVPNTNNKCIYNNRCNQYCSSEHGVCMKSENDESCLCENNVGVLKLNACPFVVVSDDYWVTDTDNRCINDDSCLQYCLSHEEVGMKSEDADVCYCENGVSISKLTGCQWLE